MARSATPGEWGHLKVLDLISDAELERLFTPGVSPEDSHTGRMLDATLRSNGKITLCMLSPGKVLSRTLALDTTVSPAELLRNGPAIPAEKQTGQP